MCNIISNIKIKFCGVEYREIRVRDRFLPFQRISIVREVSGPIFLLPLYFYSPQYLSNHTNLNDGR